MANDDLRVMFDGWALIRQANSPPALHLVELLEQAAEFCQPLLALPQQPDLPLALPASVRLVVDPQGAGPRARLVWEQRQLARLARQEGAQLLHLTAPTVGLVGRLPVVVSPAGSEGLPQRERSSLAARLREALGHGGLSRASAVFWPAGLPGPNLPGPVVRLPGLVSPEYNPIDPPDPHLIAPLGLPETYLLYHGLQDEDTLERLLAVWSWAARSIGDLYPLVVLGFTDQKRREALSERAERHGLARTVQVLPAVPPQAVASVYRGAAGLLHLGPVSAWGGAVRYALACGKPVVADQDAVGDALVGPAGYLFAEPEARKMGAALLAVVVNDDVAASLRQAALRQVGGWQINAFRRQLEDAYRAIGLQ